MHAVAALRCKHPQHRRWGNLLTCTGPDMQQNQAGPLLGTAPPLHLKVLLSSRQGTSLSPCKWPPPSLSSREQGDPSSLQQGSTTPTCRSGAP